MTPTTEKALVAAALAVAMHPVFSSVATTSLTHTATPPAWLATPLDGWLPVVPGAVWVYLSWYPATAAALWLERAAFRRAYLAYAAAFVVCITAHLLFPVTIHRPSVAGEPGLSAAVLTALYRADPPVNLFPSFHAAVAAVLTRLRPGPRALAAAMPFWMIAICVSCLLTKQHFVADVVAGFALGWIAVAAVKHVDFVVSRTDLRQFRVEPVRRGPESELAADELP